MTLPSTDVDVKVGVADAGAVGRGPPGTLPAMVLAHAGDWIEGLLYVVPVLVLLVGLWQARRA